MAVLCRYAYADDLVLLSASLSVFLQQMVNICEQEMTYLDMKFNTNKPMVLRIGKAIEDHVIIFNYLYGVDLQFVLTVKYLGIYVKSASAFKLSFLESRSNFFRFVNGIFHKRKGNVLPCKGLTVCACHTGLIKATCLLACLSHCRVTTQRLRTENCPRKVTTT